MIIRNPEHQKRTLHAIVVLCSVLFASACATTPPVSDPAVLPAPDSSRPGGVARGDTMDADLVRLWTASEEARLAGRNKVALTLLYEAIELDPQSPLLWSRAAELQLSSLEGALAESYATKSNAYAKDTDQTMLYRNWLIIEHARKMRGDLLGARSAHKKVQQYQYR